MLPGSCTCAALVAVAIAFTFVMRKLPSPLAACALQRAVVVGALTTTVRVSFEAMSKKSHDSFTPVIVHVLFAGNVGVPANDLTVHVKPAGKSSVSFTPFSVPGPSLVTTIVNSASSPALITLPAPGASGVLSILILEMTVCSSTHRLTTPLLLASPLYVTFQ